MGSVIFGLYKYKQSMECLKPVAEKICREEGMSYYSHAKTFTWCIPNDRGDYETLRFKKSEMERCD